MHRVHWRSIPRTLPNADWLAAAGSLTARLRALGHFQVDVLFQGWDRALPDEASALGIARRQRVHVRQVCLRLDATPVVLARSVISRRGISGPWCRLRNLREKPLGAALWTDPRVLRESAEFASLPAAHPLIRGCRRTSPTPARRSRYWLRGEPLVLIEAFLPAIAHWHPGRPHPGRLSLADGQKALIDESRSTLENAAHV
jgi:chorismate--pyruvate lyase